LWTFLGKGKITQIAIQIVFAKKVDFSIFTSRSKHLKVFSSLSTTRDVLNNPAKILQRNEYYHYKM
jgi:hypothetical protein